MNLKTPVKNFMNDHVVVASLKTKYSQIEELFLKYNIHHLPVTYDDKLIGIISSYDLDKFIKQQLDNGPIDKASLEANFDVEKVMTHNPTTVGPNTLLKDAVDIVVSNKFHALPVVDNGKVVGMITNNDMVRYLHYQYEHAE